MIDPKREKSRLTDEKKVRLWDWLRQHKADIEQEKYSVVLITVKVKADLGFLVSKDNVRNACRLLGVKLHREARDSPAKATLIKRLEVAEEVAARQQEAITSLNARLTSLLVALGEEKHPETRKEVPQNGQFHTLRLHPPGR